MTAHEARYLEDQNFCKTAQSRCYTAAIRASHCFRMAADELCECFGNADAVIQILRVSSGFGVCRCSAEPPDCAQSPQRQTIRYQCVTQHP
jgi:hypothetical protein